MRAGGGGGGGGGVVVLGHNPPELRDHEPSDGEGWGAGEIFSSVLQKFEKELMNDNECFRLRRWLGHTGGRPT